MNKRLPLLFVIFLVALSFLAGYLASHGRGGDAASSRARRVLYYVDPMHPSYRSDKPGIAPDCGMQLEPVYADGAPLAKAGPPPTAALPPGTIEITPDKQQLIGVKVATVEKAPWSHTLRVQGRIAPDETRIYRINAAIDGWIKGSPPATTGSLVAKNELLGTFYSPEFLSAMQAYIYGLGALDRFEPTGKETKEQITRSYATIENYRNTLRNLGMSEYQLEKIKQTRAVADFIDIRSPAAGLVLLRNVSPGQRFEKGTELFRIADISRIWILADLFENEASAFRPGMRVQVELPYQKKRFQARVSDVLPQFDPASRTLKVRLLADNPGAVMRPDMFVNVELPVSGGAAVTVPLEALLDSGLKKTVFVVRGNGFFEPREVETGHTLGERVEIVRGLRAGERIVVSGNFLIDSECRMKQAAAGITGKIARDPVCGMDIDEDRARQASTMREYRGASYFFCSPECRGEFDKAPGRYTSPPAQRQMTMPMPKGRSGNGGAGHD